MPIAVKDLCKTTQAPTAARTYTYKDHMAKRSSTVVARLDAAGAVMLGKHTMTEGTMIGHHSMLKTPINPWHNEAWTGVSSSGSGGATAAGLCFGSLGSDTGGSIRFPSAVGARGPAKPPEGAAMALSKLAHYAVRTDDLEASRRFYCEILGLRAGFRPPFRFPNLRLVQSEGQAELGLVHLIAVESESAEALSAYLGTSANAGSGVLDHIAFLVNDWLQQRARCERHGAPYTERIVPALALFQVFLVDPSSVTIELNYAAHESGMS